MVVKYQHDQFVKKIEHPTLCFPFQSDLNNDLGDHKQSNDNIEAGVTEFIVCCLTHETILNKVKKWLKCFTLN